MITLFIFFFSALANLIVRFRERPSVMLAVLGGVCWALGLLSKSTMAMMLPLALAFILVPKRGIFKPKEAGVFRFDAVYGLSVDAAKRVSDHYPVYARFVVGRDKGVGGR